MEDQLVNLIGNVGFPIAVAVYLLIRVESKMEKLTDSIVQLNVSLKKE